MGRRLELKDAVLLALLVPAWLVCLALHLHTMAEGRLAWLPVYFAPAPDATGVPTVTGFMPGADTDLVVGDRLLRCGETDLRGAGRLETFAATYDQADDERVAHFVLMREGELREARLALRPIPVAWRTIPITLGVGLAAALVLLRGRGARLRRAWALAGFAYALHWSILVGGPGWQSGLGFWLLFVSACLFMPLTLRAALLFPEGVAPRSRWVFALPWIFVSFGPLHASWMLGFPLPGEVGLRLHLFWNAAMIATLIAILARNYARADAIGRRQLKWVVYGFGVSLAPAVFAGAVASVRPELWHVYELSLLATVLLPVCVVIAIVRYNFLDIDRLISATAAYTLLTGLSLGAVFTIVPFVAERVSATADLDPRGVQTALSIALALTVVPAGRYVRPPLERLLFRERHSLETGVKQLRAELARLPGPRPLLEAVGQRLTELLRLDSCVIYGHAGSAYAPVFATGPAVPPAFDATGPLVTLLEEREAAVDKTQWRRWGRRGLIRGADRAALESLGANVVLPIKRDDALEAFVCIGEKGSGDVFTRTDLALLEGLAERASHDLLRFDQAALQREERAMHEALRSYVPAAVAQELGRGAHFEPGEREVTVLFVDVRGYTALSQGRRPEEIFDVVNAYTSAVSAVVRKHGGSVVEFHGDGLLAVFGAPQPLEAKERSAVEAGCEIGGAVAALELGDELRLGVGVGIATGEAFVGDIQSVDRKIWGCIGNTTNLAARLEGLTRTLDASVVVDATTHQRGGPRAAEFARRDDVRVKGRSDAMTIYLRALDGAA